MILRIRRRVRNIALVLAVFSLLLSSRAIVLEEEVRSCDEAFNLCLSYNPFPIVSLGYYGFVVHCSAGYIFCKKYIEKF